jgi:hypothetical protein
MSNFAIASEKNLERGKERAKRYAAAETADFPDLPFDVQIKDTTTIDEVISGLKVWGFQVLMPDSALKAFAQGLLDNRARCVPTMSQIWNAGFSQCETLDFNPWQIFEANFEALKDEGDVEEPGLVIRAAEQVKAQYMKAVADHNAANPNDQIVAQIGGQTVPQTMEPPPAAPEVKQPLPTPQVEQPKPASDAEQPPQ